MKQKFELNKPLLVNGKERKEFEYDFEEISCEQFSLASSYADSKALIANQQGRPSAAIMEQNASLHMYLGMMAIIAVNQDIDISDLERIKGYDLVSLTSIGRNFISGRSEVISEQNNSEEQSEATPESTTQESKKSKE